MHFDLQIGLFILSSGFSNISVDLQANQVDPYKFSFNWFLFGIILSFPIDYLLQK